MLSMWYLAKICIYGEHSHKLTIDSYFMLNTYQEQNLQLLRLQYCVIYSW